MSITKEPQYRPIVDQAQEQGLASFGLMTSFAWGDDPKRFGFTLSPLQVRRVFIEDAKKRMNPRWAFDVFIHDMLAGPPPGTYNAAYALDALEHIDPLKEDIFISNVLASPSPEGVVIFGMPSLESQAYASAQSKEAM